MSCNEALRALIMLEYEPLKKLDGLFLIVVEDQKIVEIEVGL